MTHWLWGAVALLALAALGVAAIKGWPLLHPPVSERARLDLNCDLRAGPCSVRFEGGGEVSFEIVPHAIPVVQPLQLRVTLKALPPPQQVEVDFAGVEMEMGFNRVVLQPPAEPRQGSETALADAWMGDASAAPPAPMVWTGRGMLPVCVRERMTWEARVLLYYPQRLLAAPFRFESVRPGGT